MLGFQSNWQIYFKIMTAFEKEFCMKYYSNTKSKVQTCKNKEKKMSHRIQSQRTIVKVMETPFVYFLRICVAKGEIGKNTCSKRGRCYIFNI